MPAIKLKKVTADSGAKQEQDSGSRRSLEDVVDDQDPAADDDDEVKPYSCFDVKVMYGKRERTLPAAEQKLIDWLDGNLEKKEGVYLPAVQLYDYYAETCQLQAAAIADVPVFNRYLRDRFGKSHGWQDTSPYKGLLNEKKIKEKKARGETLNIKMRDIIEEVIRAAGNPRKGLRFNTLKVGIMGKYPAVRIDLYPRKLKHALEHGVIYSKIERVKGMGMCGLYRLPGDPDVEVEPKKKKKKSESESEEKAGVKEEGDGVANGTDDTAEAEPKEGDDKKDRKRKASGDDATTDAPAKKKIKRKKPKHTKKVVREHQNPAEKHRNPQRVDDVFPMAITFQSDPKIASANRIKAYITKNYRTEVNVERLRKALEAGVENELWEKVSGSGMGGSYRLLIDTFHPGHSDTMTDRISQALVACHEPKTSSASFMKKYVIDYHPDLGVEARPYLFKKALERACSKGKIRQLTGIGAAGSFKLVEHFFPSPAILAGDSEDEMASESDDDVKELEQYVPRPTKHRRSPAKPDRLKINRTKPPAKKSKAGKANKPVSREQRRSVDYAEDLSDEEAYLPSPTKSRSRAVPTPTKGRVTPKAKPKPTPARKAPKQASKSARKPAAKQTTKPALKAVPDRGGKREYSSSEDEEEEDTPQPSARRGGRTPPKAAPARRAQRPQDKVQYLTVESDSSDDEAGYLPNASRSRGGPAPEASPAKKSKTKGSASSPKKSNVKRKSRRR